MPRLAKKPIGRPPGRRSPRQPIVAARVPQVVYDEIKDAAGAAGRTMGEELVWRATHYAEWVRAFTDTKALAAEAKENADALLAQAKGITAQNLQTEMRKAGYTQVRGINGAAWFEPGVASIKWIVDSLPQDLLEELMARAAARGVKLALEGEQSSARAAKIALEGEQS